jgi:hypothetical protein
MMNKSVYLVVIVVSCGAVLGIVRKNTFVRVGISNIAYQPHYKEIGGSDAFALRMKCSKACALSSICHGFNWIKLTSPAKFFCQLFTLNLTTLAASRNQPEGKVYLKLQDSDENGDYINLLIKCVDCAMI